MKKVKKSIKSYSYKRKGKIVVVPNHKRTYHTASKRRNFGIGVTDYGSPGTGTAVRQTASQFLASDLDSRIQRRAIRDASKAEIERSRELRKGKEKEADELEKFIDSHINLQKRAKYAANVLDKFNTYVNAGDWQNAFKLKTLGEEKIAQLRAEEAELRAEEEAIKNKRPFDRLNPAPKDWLNTEATYDAIDDIERQHKFATSVVGKTLRGVGKGWNVTSKFTSETAVPFLKKGVGDLGVAGTEIGRGIGTFASRKYQQFTTPKGPKKGSIEEAQLFAESINKQFGGQTVPTSGPSLSKRKLDQISGVARGFDFGIGTPKVKAEDMFLMPYKPPTAEV